MIVCVGGVVTAVHLSVTAWSAQPGLRWARVLLVRAPVWAAAARSIPGGTSRDADGRSRLHVRRVRFWSQLTLGTSTHATTTQPPQRCD